MANYEKLDHWSLKAQKEGYPARSVYKLKEMDEKFGLLPAGRAGGRGKSGADSGNQSTEGGRSPFRVLDLGAAPGSWSLYALRKLGSGIFLSAADLSPLSRQYDKGLFDADNVFFIQGDITAAETREALISHGPYALVMSDAAPATTGNRSVDTLRSLGLAEAVLDYAEAALEKGGNLALKVFQGGDTAEILKRIRELFKTGKSFKPAACRSESFETYYLGLDRR
ncbi:ribosomal RNA large subunit methyltransferase E [Spirochaetia bacterium]|nr:ribosomal RNA large subunit methyltransferase E [Spirochaetia bacterium]